MPKVKILDTGKDIVRFVVEDDDGRQGRPQELPIRIKQKPKNKSLPLEMAIAQELGLDTDKVEIIAEEEEGPRGVTLDEVKRMFREELESVAHLHPYAKEGHQHDDMGSAAEIKQLLVAHEDMKKVLVAYQKNAAALKADLQNLQKEYAAHAADTFQHPYSLLRPQINSLLEEISALRGQVSALSNRELPEHSDDHKGLLPRSEAADAVNRLNQAIVDLREYVRQRDDEIAESIPEVPELPEPGLSEAEVLSLLRSELDSRRNKAHFREISTQEVRGKQRYVVEEV